MSSLVDLARDPESLARRLRRPVPSEPAVHARRGTAFHRWLEGYFSGEALVAVGDLPGAGDRSAAPDPELDDLRARFLSSAWAFRVPQEIEMPFATRIGGIGVRGRIDAVFADGDGGLTVVDWKTGRPPAAATGRRRPCSWPVTGWPSASCGRYRSIASGQRSTTSPPVTRSRPPTCWTPSVFPT